MTALEMARKMETDAIKFYSEAAERTKYGAGKKMLLSIVDDEKRHLKMISEIIKGLSITIQDVSPMKKVKTVFEAMKDEMMAKVEASDDELEALNVAMKMEQEGKELMSLMGPEYDQLAATGGGVIDDVFGHFPDLGWDRLARTFLRTEEA